MARTRGEVIRRRRAEGASSQVSDEDAVLLQDVHSHPRHATLLRTYVSRNSAGKGRALLAYVGLKTAQINMCYVSYPRNEEEAVQTGLNKWIESDLPKTWRVLIGAMEYAEIAIWDITELKEKLLNQKEEKPVESDENRKPKLWQTLSVAFSLLLLLVGIAWLFFPTVEPVAVFRGHLQDSYNKTTAPSSNLTHLKVPGVKFFQPLIYEAEKVSPYCDAEERLQQGKEPIVEYRRVMQAASGGKVVLLEGPPGSGKSTVSRQLCKDWAEGVIRTEFELVVLVPLCELRKKREIELEDLLRVAYENLPNGVVQHIEAVGGKEMLFILDGYDEIKSHTKGAPAVVESLLEKSYLQQSSVIVTSRGIAARSLYHRVDKRFVIQGLKQGVISDFVHYYFEGSKEKATQLLNKLSAAPRLAAACSNTLALAIVCYLHSKQESIPTNVTGLYGRFLVISLEEFAEQSPEPDKLLKFMEKYNSETLLGYLTSIWHPASNFSHLSALAELALEGILQNKFVFETTDEMMRRFPEGFDGYGLLDTTVITDDYGIDTKLYRLNFLHLTMQEFMAALFVASWTPEEQAAFWRKHFTFYLDRCYRCGLVNDRFLTVFLFYCGLTGLENKGVQAYLLEEVNKLLPFGCKFDQALVSICTLAAESGNKEFACSLLSPLGKKVELDVDTHLSSANVAWCLTACKKGFEELVVTTAGNLVHTVAAFLSQLNQLTSLSVLELPYMECSSDVSTATCSEEFQTISGFWKMQTCPKRLKMKFRKSLKYIPQDLPPQIQEMTLKDVQTISGLKSLKINITNLLRTISYNLLSDIQEITLEDFQLITNNQLVTILKELPLLQTLVLEGVSLRSPNRSQTSYEEGEDPSVIGAISDAVKRHPNLTEVTVRRIDSRSLFIGVLKGVLQKADVRKVVAKESCIEYFKGQHSKTSDAMGPTSATDDLVQEYLIPAMKGGSLKVVAVTLEKSSSVESILRALPHTNIEELAIGLDTYPYSEPSHCSLVAAAKAGLSASKTLKKFSMVLGVQNLFPIDYILTSVTRPLEELVLSRFAIPRGVLANSADHLHKLSLKKVILLDVSGITPTDIAAMLVGGLGQNGTLEELVITNWHPENQSYQDVEDEETLQAVEAAVRESTSVKRIMLDCERLWWTNVATALLRGAIENKSLRLLTLKTPESSPPPQDVVGEVRQKRRTLVFGINVISWNIEVDPSFCYIDCIHWTDLSDDQVPEEDAALSQEVHLEVVDREGGSNKSRSLQDCVLMMCVVGVLVVLFGVGLWQFYFAVDRSKPEPVVDRSKPEPVVDRSKAQSITANDRALRDELTRDGGYRSDIYMDTTGHAIVGIGHLIVPGDPEHGRPVGARVTDARVQELFTRDLSVALEDCNAVFPSFGTLPQEAQRIMANMMFNLGRPRFKRFKKLIAAVNAHDWSKAADEMVDSKWYGQVGDRSKRLVRRMRSLAK